MTSKISTATAVTGADISLRSTAGDVSQALPKSRSPKGDPVDYRLVIEEDQASGSFVYKTLDRRTGEVVSQFPREQMLRLASETNYEAGAVISTKA